MITTKKGDNGKSHFFGRTANKDGCLIEAWGEVDELAGVLAVVAEQVEGFKKVAEEINENLFQISGYFAGCGKVDLKPEIEKMEKIVEEREHRLKPVRCFLKAGKDLNVWINLARTVSRRVERRIVGLVNSGELKEVDEYLVKYFNRLSDYLFILSRKD